jgi:hypothetical protein
MVDMQQMLASSLRDAFRYIYNDSVHFCRSSIKRVRFGVCSMAENMNWRADVLVSAVIVIPITHS